MVSRLFWTGVCVCLTAASTLAQDPTKVEKSSMHEHPGGVVVILTAAHLRFTDENGKTREVFSKPGEARWYPPFHHRVENLGDTPYDAVYVGIKGMNASNGSKNPMDALDEETSRIVAKLMASAND